MPGLQGRVAGAAAVFQCVPEPPRQCNLVLGETHCLTESGPAARGALGVGLAGAQLAASEVDGEGHPPPPEDLAEQPRLAAQRRPVHAVRPVRRRGRGRGEGADEVLPVPGG